MSYAAFCIIVPPTIFWFFWTICGVGGRYFYFLPAPYQSIPFWDCFGLFVVIGALKWILLDGVFYRDTKTGSEREEEE